MTRTRTTAGVVALLVVCLSACQSKEAVVVADPMAEALAYVPADAAVTVVVQTDPRAGAGAALARLADRVPGGALLLGRAEGLLGARLGLDGALDLRPLRGNPVVGWSGPGGRSLPFAAWVAADAAKLGALLDARVQRGALQATGEADGFALLVRGNGAALAHKGPILVVAPDLPALREVVARRAAGGGQWSAGLLRERRLGLPGGAVAELLADARPFRERALGPRALRVPWVAALRRVAMTVGAEPGGLRLRARASTATGALTDADVPIAGGVAAPVTRGAGRLVLAVRDPRHLLAFLRRTSDLLDPRRLAGLRTVEDLLSRYARVSLQEEVVARLTGSATLTSQDLRAATVRFDVDDPGAIGDVLDRVGTLARFGGPLAGLAGVDLQGYGVDERDGAEVVMRDGHDVVGLAVQGGALVASTVPGADLAAAGTAPAPAGSPPAAGALRATVDADLWREELIRRLGLPPLVRGPLSPFGRLVVTASGARTGLDLQLVIPVAG